MKWTAGGKRPLETHCVVTFNREHCTCTRAHLERMDAMSTKGDESVQCKNFTLPPTTTASTSTMPITTTTSANATATTPVDETSDPVNTNTASPTLSTATSTTVVSTASTNMTTASRTEIPTTTTATSAPITSSFSPATTQVVASNRLKKSRRGDKQLNINVRNLIRNSGRATLKKKGTNLEDK